MPQILKKATDTNVYISGLQAQEKQRLADEARRKELEGQRFNILNALAAGAAAYFTGGGSLLATGAAGLAAGAAGGKDDILGAGLKGVTTGLAGKALTPTAGATAAPAAATAAQPTIFDIAQGAKQLTPAAVAPLAQAAPAADIFAQDKLLLEAMGKPENLSKTASALQTVGVPESVTNPLSAIGEIKAKEAEKKLLSTSGSKYLIYLSQIGSAQDEPALTAIETQAQVDASLRPEEKLNVGEKALEQKQKLRALGVTATKAAETTAVKEAGKVSNTTKADYIGRIKIDNDKKSLMAIHAEIKKDDKLSGDDKVTAYNAIRARLDKLAADNKAAAAKIKTEAESAAAKAKTAANEAKALVKEEEAKAAKALAKQGEATLKETYKNMDAVVAQIRKAKNKKAMLQAAIDNVRSFDELTAAQQEKLIADLKEKADL